MDARELNLDCTSNKDGTWRVYCLNSGLTLSNHQKSAEFAWALAAEKLAKMVSEIRRATYID